MKVYTVEDVCNQIHEDHEWFRKQINWIMPLCFFLGLLPGILIGFIIGVMIK